MAFIESQQNPGIVQEVDPAQRAGRVSVRPLDHTTLQGKILGHYRVAGNTTGALFTAAVVLATLRWADPTNFLVLTRVRAWVSVSTVVTSVGTLPLILNINRSYTASETTSINNILPTQGGNKMRTNMSPTLVTQLVTASAAAGITGGTKVVDNAPCGTLGVNGMALGAQGTGFGGEMYACNTFGQHPIVLSANEGLQVAWGNSTLGSGSVIVTVEWEWTEVAGF